MDEVQPPPLEEPLDPPLELPLDEPLELPLDDPPELPLDDPLELPLLPPLDDPPELPLVPLELVLDPPELPEVPLDVLLDPPLEPPVEPPLDIVESPPAPESSPLVPARPPWSSPHAAASAAQLTPVATTKRKRIRSNYTGPPDRGTRLICIRAAPHRGIVFRRLFALRARGHFAHRMGFGSPP